MEPRQITRADIMPLPEYAKVRDQKRREIVSLKKLRRLHVGPYATVHFECYATMWLQVQEMLYIEKGGDAQLADELAAYNPLIPDGADLVATIMFEIDDPVRRKAVLDSLGGVEDTVFIGVAGEQIAGRPEADVDRTSASGKASSVQFVHFAFAPRQIALFRANPDAIVIGFGHPNYAHMAALSAETARTLAGDFAA